MFPAIRKQFVYSIFLIRSTVKRGLLASEKVFFVTSNVIVPSKSVFCRNRLLNDKININLGVFRLLRKITKMPPKKRTVKKAESVEEAESLDEVAPPTKNKRAKKNGTEVEENNLELKDKNVSRKRGGNISTSEAVQSDTEETGEPVEKKKKANKKEAAKKETTTLDSEKIEEPIVKKTRPKKDNKEKANEEDAEKEEKKPKRTEKKTKHTNEDEVVEEEKKPKKTEKKTKQTKDKEVAEKEVKSKVVPEKEVKSKVVAEKEVKNKEVAEKEVKNKEDTKPKKKETDNKTTKKTKEKIDEKPKPEKVKKTVEKKEKPPKKEPTAEKKTSNDTKTDWEQIDFASDKKNAEGNESNLKITSWNVDGLRAWLKKDGMNIFQYCSPDILCLQETKCNEASLPSDITDLEGYEKFWCSSDKNGYAGVGVLTKQKPLKVLYGIDDEEQDEDGRCITVEFDKYYLVTVYVPNAGRKLVTLDKRLEWNEAFKNFIKELDKKKPVVICGDMNVAHNEIDLRNPKTNTKNAGFTQEERDGMTEFLEEGFVDTFRALYPDKEDSYTFWTYMMNSRKKNVGWRLDYFIVSDRIKDKVCDNVIHDKVLGSDHCPVTLFMNI